MTEPTASTSKQTTTTTTKQYTFEEVRETTDGRKRTLMVVHDKVYDVAGFLNEHPGGEEILLEHGGSDATEDFVDVNHSADAVDLMAQYLVGEIVPEQRRNLREESRGWRAGGQSGSGPDPQKEKYVKGPGMPFALLVGAIALAVVAALYLVN